MKLNLLAVLLLICLFEVSCDSVSNENKGYNNYSKAQLFMKNFIKQNPDMAKNDIKMQDAVLSYISQFESFIDTNGLSDTRFKLKSLSPIDNGYGLGYVMHFENDTAIPNNDMTSSSHLDIFAVTDRETAEKYTQSDTVFYKITSCNEAKRIPSDDIRLVTQDMMWTGGINFGQEFDFGNYVVKSPVIEQIK
ncbi:hypothetical protein KXD93_22680 [Mucilaginibacter sp. BJC16-A38]|uniref:hypothetical protein n=1 Tax=Mucilaginibacter phenanthrenivorans TaxID=1234842 RepID=UPI002157A672|nr:hypothetical protein [Mucilaginibacter phenanthrenivorans]MCR8560478.1 hypothetical protein [Mucilaginibacter phenanthrenivorans]